MRSQLSASLSRLNVGTALVTAAFGPFVYWLWGRAASVHIDVWGLVLAGVIPLPAVVVTRWLWFRTQAPAELVNRFKVHYDAQNPPCPLAGAGTASEVGIALQLLPANRVHNTSVLDVEEIDCKLALKAHYSTLRQPISVATISPESPVEVCYPKDFKNPIWPLPPGRYDFSWHARFGGRNYNFGHPVYIGSRTARRRVRRAAG